MNDSKFNPKDYDPRFNKRRTIGSTSALVGAIVGGIILGLLVALLLAGVVWIWSLVL